MSEPITSAAFASAAQPIAADTLIITETRGLVEGEVAIPTSHGVIPAYRAAPEGVASALLPVVLVVQEIFGVHEHIRDVARRFAQLGYLAVAPELYHRQGDVSKLATIDEIRKVVSKVPDEQVLRDLDATAAWAAAHGGDPDRLGITGFCWGGRIVWLYAAHQPKLKAGVAWYGRVATEPTELQPRSAIDVASSLHGPVLGLYGGQDQGIPLSTVDQLRARLREAGSPSSIHVYDDAPHAFYADYRPSYRKEPAEDGWKRLQAWFKQHGLTASPG
jgi:carboxymethylenebutenolidase